MPIQLTLVDAGFGIQQLPDGGRIMHFVDQQTNISVIIPLSAKAAESIGAELRGSGIQIATAMPKEKP